MTAAMAPQCRRPLRVDLRQVCEEVLGFVHGYGNNGVWRHRWNVPSNSSNLVIHSSVWNPAHLMAGSLLVWPCAHAHDNSRQLNVLRRKRN